MTIVQGGRTHHPVIVTSPTMKLHFTIALWNQDLLVLVMATNHLPLRARAWTQNDQGMIYTQRKRLLGQRTRPTKRKVDIG